MMNMGYLNQLLAKKQKQKQKSGADRKNDRITVSVNSCEGASNEQIFNKAYYFQDGLYNLSLKFSDFNMSIFSPSQQKVIKQLKTHDKITEARAKCNFLMMVNDPGFSENFTISNNYLLFWSEKNVWASAINGHTP
jgi:hypothetical protein